MSDIRPNYKAGFDALWLLCCEMQRNLTAERDEARRMWCEAIWLQHGRETPKQLAKEKGWDCYERKLEP